MKILFITSSSINGGAQKHIKEMFGSLSGMGHAVYLVAPEGWLLSKLEEYGDNIICQNNLGKNIRSLRNIIRQIRPDIINTFILSGGCYGTFAWKRDRIGKLFITVNNPVLYDGISKIRKVLYPIFYRWMARYATAFLVKSDKVKEEVMDLTFGKCPVLSIKNGMDFSIFNKNINMKNWRYEFEIGESEVVVTNVAALDVRKGQDYLIDAICCLRRKYKIHLFIAGEGEYRKILENKIKVLNAEKFVHLLGMRNDVNAILAHTDIFVLSSLHEGLPNSLMEAMAMGLPCIATDVGGVRQLIQNEDNGLIVQAKKSDELYNAIEMLINDDSLRNMIGENAYRKIYNEYKQECVAEELCQIYRKYIMN